MKLQHLIIGALLAASSCSKFEASAPKASEARQEEVAADSPAAPAVAFERDDAEESGRRGGGKLKKAMRAKGAMKEEAFAGLSAIGGGPGGGGADGFAEVDAKKMVEGKPEPELEPVSTRAWFPESFLFEPRVMTDASGDGSFTVKVPDRLTTWRVLALAHSKEGAQAGALTTFLGTLPVYLDPVVPAFLSTGDEVDLPIQVVNTTNQRLERVMKLESSGVASVSGSGSVAIGPETSVVKYARIVARKPGNVKISASLASADAVERTFAVIPTGKPMREERGGTLAAPRTLEIDLPADLEDESAILRLQVFPGALALLRSELGAASMRSGPAADAHLLLLAGQARSLLTTLGGDVDDEALRKLAISASQRAMKWNRSNDPRTAAMFAEAALAHPDNPVLARLGERLVLATAQAQRPDGTFFGESGWTVQRLLVATADGVSAVSAGAINDAGKQRATRAKLIAGGAVERMIGRVEDPYTAAALLASGAVEGSIADKLRQRVKDAIVARTDGAKELPVPVGVTRADGTVPSTIEATALAVLALEKDPSSATLMPDLGATLLGAYRPAFGFGDGRTNLLTLRAVLKLFKDPLPSRVQVKVSRDGKVLAEGVLEGQRLKDVLVLDAPAAGSAGAHVYSVEATPPVPGLGYTMELRYYVPWKEEERVPGLDLLVDIGKNAVAGKPLDVTLRAIAPNGAALKIRHALPAGVLPDKPSLEKLVESGAIESFDTEDGAVTINAPDRDQGQSFMIRYRVVPTLGGKLHSSASSVELAYDPAQLRYVPPAVWTIATH
jgi:hypothetical protein